MKALNTLPIFKLIFSYKITSTNYCLTWIDWYHTQEDTDFEDPRFWESEKIFWVIDLQWNHSAEIREQRSLLNSHSTEGRYRPCLCCDICIQDPNRPWANRAYCCLASVPSSSPLTPYHLLFLFSFPFFAFPPLFHCLLSFFAFPLPFHFHFELSFVIGMPEFNLYFPNG